MKSDDSSTIILDHDHDHDPTSSSSSTRFAKFTQIKTLRDLGAEIHVGSYVKLYGWIQGVRIQKTIGFIDLSDGTTVTPIRCLAAAASSVAAAVVEEDQQQEEEEGTSSSSHDVAEEGGTTIFFRPKESPSLLLSHATTTQTPPPPVDGDESRRYQRLSYEELSQTSCLSVGCSVMILGYVDLAPAKASQSWEIKIVELYVIGGVQDPTRYPITKSIQQKPPVALRQYHHCRFKAPLIQQLMSIRSQALFAIHEFMHSEGIPQLDPSVLTSSDCEGAGEVFKIQQQDLFFIGSTSSGDDDDYDDSSSSSPTRTTTTRQQQQQIGLTVSSQLPLEAIAMGTGSVYTCQKSFRAEKSDTSKHLAEFLHVEFERYFITLEELMDFTERFLKTIIQTVLTRCSDQYEFLSRKKCSSDEYFGQHSTWLTKHLLEKPFVRITHRQAVDILLEDLRAKVKVPPTKEEGGCCRPDDKKMIRLKFSTLPQHGKDLESEHEKYLLQKFGTCVFVTHWPSQLASFYMKKVDDDGDDDGDGDGTCESFDLLAPFVGELFGGSMREWRYDVLLERMKSKGMEDVSVLQWYLDLRKDGSAPHGGWGMGFDRLVMLLTRATSIRDVTPYPVYYGHCPY